MLWGVVIYFAAIKDRTLKFLLKIPMTYAHLIYTLFCPSFVLWTCFKRCKTLFLYVFGIFMEFLHISLFFHCYENWKTGLKLTLSVIHSMNFLCFTTYGCCHSCYLIKNAFFVPRNSACRVEGEGKDKIEIDVPLKGCGTQQVNSGHLRKQLKNAFLIKCLLHF